MSEAAGLAWPALGLVLPEYTDRSMDWLVDYAERADSAGVESIWVGESWGYNPFSLLGRVAERTDCPLGTSIANVFARSPAALAAGTLGLHDATDGRFFLGLGTSTPNVVEGFHGQNFDRPLRRLRETIEILDLALSGERIDYNGEVFDLQGFRLNHADGAIVPVLNAALGTTNIALTIDYADALAPHMLPLPALEDALAAGRERANSDREIRLVPVLPTAISEDPESARRALAGHIAAYVGPADFYHDVIASNGFPHEAAAIRDAWQAGDREAATDAVSESLQDAVGVAGTPDAVRRRIRDLHDGPADATLHTFPEGATEEMFEATVATLPDALD